MHHAPTSCSRATPLFSRLLIAALALAAVLTTAAAPQAQNLENAPVGTVAGDLHAAVGALLLPRLSGGFLADDDPELQHLQRLVREEKVGGAVFFAGDPLSVASTIERLRAAAPPGRKLLFGLDAEWGAAMRLQGTTQWPRAMALGAAGNPTLAYEMGRNTATEARAIGIDLVLAPVADLALRADNGVIGNRSFGGDPKRVASLVAAFVRGVQSTGAIAVVKHFPGHGATAEDSHSTLPILDIDEGLLRRRELVPFRAAITAGVAAVMPGHLALPAIDPTGAPASLSPILLRDLLRGELGFEGLIVSDALDMRGARTLTWDGRVSAQALAAGVDLLLLPTHPEASHAEILRAVARGDVTPQRILEAQARRHQALDRVRAATLAEARGEPTAVLAEAEAHRLASQVAAEAITLYPAQSSSSSEFPEVPGVPAPLPSWSPPPVVLLELDHHPQRRSLLPLRRALAQRTAVDWIRLFPLPPGATYGGAESADLLTAPPELEDGELAVLAPDDALQTDALQTDADTERNGNVRPLAELHGPLAAFASRLARARVVLVGLQRGGPNWCATPGCASLNDEAHPLVSDLAALQRSGKEVLILAFADPWPLQAAELAGFHRLAAHDGSAAAQHALAAALFGETAIEGTPPLWPQAVARVRPHHHSTRLRRAPPASVGMSAAGLAEARGVLERAVADGTTPSAVALVVRRGAIVFEEAFGRLAEPEHLPDGFPLDADGAPKSASLDTVYGLASLTKVVATTTLAMRLNEAGRLDLDRRVIDYLPEYLAAAREPAERERRTAMKVRHLLTHSSGMLWWTDLHLRHGVQEHAGRSPEEARRAYLEEIYRLPLQSAPGEAVAYSDLGILLLGEILARVGGAPFAELVRREVLEPLGMSDTTFDPPAELRSRIAPTEFDPWRSQVVWGEVHDENAAGLGGVAPHAGLFSTAEDLARFAQMMLSGGIADGKRYLNGRTIDQFTTRAAELPADSTRALGWDTPSASSNGGQYVSARAFGHTGFVGTSIWIDPQRELFVILLTNRVHPTRDDLRIRDLRPALHDAVLRAIVDEKVEPRPGSEPR